MTEPWYERSFREDYLLVYKHRDKTGAEAEVRAMSEWLGLPKGARVLDLCCGSGRHSIVLDALGYIVTGLDLSETLLREAKADGAGRPIRWIRGDMRRVPLDEPFQAVFNMFTSFGYFDSDEENEAVLHEICRLLHPGGRFVIDFLNPSYVRSNLVPHSIRHDGNTVIEEKRSIQGEFVVKTIRIAEPGAPERHYREQVRLYELEQFRTMIAKAGLHLDEVFGGYRGEAYSVQNSTRIILVGTKKEGTA